MNTQKITSPSIAVLREHYPTITFEESDIFYWSPREKTVYFNPQQLKKDAGIFQLLHEIGHALCQHTNYRSGIELMKMEVEAWEKAQEIAKHHNISISEQRIEKCLDSYRDWLHLRSCCPTCRATSVETEENQFQCFNCRQRWSVPENQQTRGYRLKQIANSK